MAGRRYEAESKPGLDGNEQAPRRQTDVVLCAVWVCEANKTVPAVPSQCYCVAPELGPAQEGVPA